MRRIRLALLALLASASLASAEVKLPAVISDNMVIQANKPVRIWGTAAPAEKVTVTLADQTQSVTADPDGKWQVTLKPLAAGQTPKLTVAGTNTLTVNNAIVGSVWICSGQSNMEFGIKNAHNAATEIPAAKYPKIRLFTVTKSTAITPQADVTGKWLECTPENVVLNGWGGFSAVAYFFGRDLHVATGQPIGLVHTSWGGTPAQSWTSLEALRDVPELKHYVEAPFFRDLAKAPEIIKADYEKAFAAWEPQQRKWDAEVKPGYDEKLKAWTAAVKEAKAAGKPEPVKPQPSRPSPKKPVQADKSPWTPTTLYNAMIAPLTPMAIEGAIWYQGEANGGLPEEYRTLFPTMITDWRKRWGQSDFPFYFVQLANFMAREDKPSDPDWAYLRDSQLQTLKLPKTGMALAIDIGQANDIHPRNKADVGHRLALWALRDVYGKSNTVVSGPLYESMKVEGSRIRVSFKETGSGLTIAAAPSTQPGVEPAKPAAEVQGFAIAGEDHQWVWANATIDGNTVVVWSDQVAKPVAVRYAWANNPACNLYNKEGLPVSPFRTDDFPRPPKPAK